MAGVTVAGCPSGGQPHQPQPPGLPPTPILADLLKRAGNAEGYRRWADQVRHARYCTHPVRLAGAVDQVDTASGEVRTVFDTTREPDGVVLKACGTRRAARCQPCARVYHADAYQLVKVGVGGGKGIPNTVSTHPRVFATFTAPSFGRVHTRRERGGTIYPCHAAKLGERCEHGRRRGCWHKHAEDDPALGSPLCADCYDYQCAVIWNALAPVLWRRTTIYLRRTLARLSGHTVAALAREMRVSYVKVAEYQARGAIHYHAVIRLDGVGDDGETIAPPTWATVELLNAAIRQAATAVRVPCPVGLGLDPVGWGSQLDIRAITAGVLGAGTEGHVAGYLAKYATKATEALAGVALDRPIRSGAALARLALPEHIRRMVETCWRVGARPDLARLQLRARAHQLGYGGHCLSKSRRYSITFGALRRARHEHARRQAFNGEPLDAWGRPEHQGAAVQVGAWAYAGRGYTTLGDAWLARSLLENAQEERRIAREELTAVA
jgi:Replication initiator protein, pSAM2